MTIYETLTIEHAGITKFLDDLIEKTTTSDGPNEDWREALHDLKTALLTHNRAEEAVFYDVLDRLPERGELADIKTEEHRLAEEALTDLEESDPQDRDWRAKLDLLKNDIASHIAEEETLVFGIVQTFLSDDEAERLSNEFNRQKEELVLSFRHEPVRPIAAGTAGLKP